LGVEEEGGYGLEIECVEVAEIGEERSGVYDLRIVEELFPILTILFAKVLSTSSDGSSM
jgi:hypothetical protein